MSDDSVVQEEEGAGLCNFKAWLLCIIVSKPGDEGDELLHLLDPSLKHAIYSI